jgi:transcriptional regulator with XRE-family HTH domain
VNYTYLGPNLIFQRKLQGLSQLDLAIATDGVVSQAYISRIEQGWPQPNPAYVSALAKALAVGVDALTRRPRFVTGPNDARVVVLRRRR